MHAAALYAWESCEFRGYMSIDLKVAVGNPYGWTTSIGGYVLAPAAPWHPEKDVFSRARAPIIAVVSIFFSIIPTKP